MTGCGGQKKIKECNALIAVINSGVEKVQKGTRASPDGGTPVSELRALADDLSDEHIAEVVRLSSLDDLQGVWTRRRQVLDGWNRTLSRHLRRQEESLTELAALEKRWAANTKSPSS